ncbi:MAG: hypothetical protein MSS51_05335, partial [Bacteroidales bacterium]|nr:hypothetical protein [Bacteroidales bacterium]
MKKSFIFQPLLGHAATKQLPLAYKIPLPHKAARGASALNQRKSTISQNHLGKPWRMLYFQNKCSGH